MHLVRPNSNLRRLLVAAAAVGAAIAAAVANAAKPAVPPVASFTIDGGQLTSALRPTVAGTLTCTKNAHYHLYAWLSQQDRGALAKGAIPPKLPPRPTKLAVERARAATLCTGASQPWSLPLASVGKQSAGLVAGTAMACVVVYAGKSHLYTLAQTCKEITLP